MNLPHRAGRVLDSLHALLHHSGLTEKRTPTARRQPGGYRARGPDDRRGGIAVGVQPDESRGRWRRCAGGRFGRRGSSLLHRRVEAEWKVHPAVERSRSHRAKIQSHSRPTNAGDDHGFDESCARNLLHLAESKDARRSGRFGNRYLAPTGPAWCGGRIRGLVLPSNARNLSTTGQDRARPTGWQLPRARPVPTAHRRPLGREKFVRRSRL